METLIVTGAAGSIGTRVCKTLAETDGVAAILAIDTVSYTHLTLPTIYSV